MPASPVSSPAPPDLVQCCGLTPRAVLRKGLPAPRLQPLLPIASEVFPGPSPLGPAGLGNPSGVLGPPPRGRVGQGGWGTAADWSAATQPSLPALPHPQTTMPGMKRDCGGAAAILGAFRAAIKQVSGVPPLQFGGEGSRGMPPPPRPPLFFPGNLHPAETKGSNTGRKPSFLSSPSLP